MGRPSRDNGLMAQPFRIHVGDRLPVQHSGFTCGSSSLTVARMLADPTFAAWVSEGKSEDPTLPAGSTPDARLAAVEDQVLARTTALVGPGRRLQLPWPRRFGTPPWGARAELENGAAPAGTRYEVRWCRWGSEQRLRDRVGQVRDRVGQDRPALLYIGSSTLPRHVTLLVASETGPGLDVYDPSAGSLQALDVDAFAGRRLAVAGWPVPWCVVQPRSQ